MSSGAATSMFKTKDFFLGSWASPLAHVLKERWILPQLEPVCRVLRNSKSRWVQYRPAGFDGPEHWRVKPAILPSDLAIFVGCYVERGLPRSLARDPNYVFEKMWRWNGFIACLDDDSMRAKLGSFLNNLPAARTCIRLWFEKGEQEVIPYSSAKQLSDLRERLKSIPEEKWINCLLGVSFTKDECLGLQAKIIAELRNPIIRASEMADLIEQAMPR